MEIPPNTNYNAMRDLINKIPKFIQMAIASYETLCSHDAWDDHRSYGAHQTACRAALTHLDILLRIESGLRTSYAPADWTLATDIESLLMRANAEIEGSGCARMPEESLHIPQSEIGG